MDLQALLNQTPAKDFKVFERREGMFQLVAPLFYPDGDMLTIFLEEGDNGLIRLCDHGETLMRLSYSFDIDTDKKRNVLDDIILNRSATLLDGDLQLYARPENIFEKIMAYTQLVSEVDNMDILSHENVAQLFYDYLNSFIETLSTSFNIVADYTPPGYSDIQIDYAFLNKGTARPIYLFGVKDTTKALRSTIHCLNLTLHKVPHRSIAVFENMESIERKAKNSLVNAAGKIYADLSGFQETGKEYIENELSA